MLHLVATTCQVDKGYMGPMSSLTALHLSPEGSAMLLSHNYTTRVHEGYHVQACRLHNNVSCIKLTHGQPFDGGLGVADNMGGTAAQVSTPHNLTPTCLDSLMHPACTMGSSAYYPLTTRVTFATPY